MNASFLSELQRGLTQAQADFARRFPGDSGARQPVSVLYGGAHLFKSDTPQKLGALALKALRDFAPDAGVFGEAFGFSPQLAARVYPRVLAKLSTEPLEELRVDFEDGYGHRSDDEEDAHARAAGEAYAQAKRPAFSGVRVKPMSAELGLRAVRTLELFLAPLATVPEGFVVTLPKVVSVAQVKLFVSALEALEHSRGWAPGTLRFEVMVEAAQGLVGEDGRALLPQLLHPRLRGAHFGAYDFTASLDVPAAEQRLHHPACDVARAQMQLAFSGTGVWLSDGATTQLPVAIHRAEPLSAAQRAENRAAVHAAWRRAADDTRRSLAHGFFQGWDLHPAQLVSRYAAVYGFFADNLAEATERLAKFVQRSGRATLVGTTFDDAATGQGLLNFFLRGLACGALAEDELLATGLTREELASRSFAVIARNRRA